MTRTQLDRIEAELKYHRALMVAILRQGGIQMANIDDVIAAVANETNEIDSVKVFIKNLQDQLTAAGTDPAKIQAVLDGIAANTAALAAAITTPGA